MDMEERIHRINELYHKSKETGLSASEMEEQKALREDYIRSIRGSIRSQLDNIDIKEADGTVINVGEKIRQKEMSASDNGKSSDSETDMPDFNDKNSLRRYMIAKRKSLPEDAAGIFSSLICENVTCLTEYKNADTVLLYKSYNHEVNTDKLFMQALSDGKKIAYPKSLLVNGVPGLEFYYINDLKHLSPGYKGIMEPDIFKYNLEKYEGESALCFVPGVVFDEDCNRIGYGKGFYDTFLHDHSNITTVGLAFSLQIVEKIPCYENDVAMDILITEDTDEYYTR